MLIVLFFSNWISSTLRNASLWDYLPRYPGSACRTASPGVYRQSRGPELYTVYRHERRQVRINYWKNICLLLSKFSLLLFYYFLLSSILFGLFTLWVKNFTLLVILSWLFSFFLKKMKLINDSIYLIFSFLSFPSIFTVSFKRPYRNYVQRVEEMERQVRFLYENIQDILRSSQFDDLILVTNNDSSATSSNFKLDTVEKSLKQFYENFKKSKENNEWVYVSI
jgi:hypothetical protein